MKKLLISGAVITAIGLSAAIPTLAVSAESNASQGNLVDKIATQFHLNKDDVQKVFTENWQANQVKHKQAEKDHLATLVKDGKITQVQSDLISTKLAELQTEREANHDDMKSKTSAERKAFMDSKKAELEQWAKDNGIDISLLHPQAGPGHRASKTN